MQPVHFKPDNKGNLPPSALVPFCSYQGNNSLLRQQRIGFQNLTFCDKFQPTILEGQLCYSLDVTKLERKATKTGKRNGLFLLLDPNPYPMESTDGRVKAARNDQESFKVYIHTLAEYTAFGPGAYAIHNLKRMTGKSSFYQLPDSQKYCQVHSREKCQTDIFLSQVEFNCKCVLWTPMIHISNYEVPLLVFIWHTQLNLK